MMTVAYIQSDALRRLCLVLLVLASPPLLCLLFVVRSFTCGVPRAWKETLYQLTQGRAGYWRSVRECWRASVQKRNAAQRMVGRY